MEPTNKHEQTDGSGDHGRGSHLAPPPTLSTSKIQAQQEPTPYPYISSNNAATENEENCSNGVANPMHTSQFSKPVPPPPPPQPEVPPKRTKSKKPKDKPRRPLSAYNLFFSDQKEQLLEARRKGIKQPDFMVPTEKELEQQKLEEGENGVPKKKTPVLFQALAKCIGARWRVISDEDRKKYDALAKEEMEMYRKRMEAYEKKLCSNSAAMANNVEVTSGKRKRLDPFDGTTENARHHHMAGSGHLPYGSLPSANTNPHQLHSHNAASSYYGTFPGHAYYAGYHAATTTSTYQHHPEGSHSSYAPTTPHHHADLNANMVSQVQQYDPQYQQMWNSQAPNVHQYHANIHTSTSTDGHNPHSLGEKRAEVDCHFGRRGETPASTDAVSHFAHAYGSVVLSHDNRPTHHQEHYPQTKTAEERQASYSPPRFDNSALIEL